MKRKKEMKSAGLLLFYNDKKDGLMVFLIHHGGPLWKGKNIGAWDIPKGEPDGELDLLKVAKREFYEETGIKLNEGKYISLGNTFNKWGKEIFIWAIRGSGREKFISSNLFELEWPKCSGKIERFEEADNGRYMKLREAKIKAHSYTGYFFDRLLEILKKDENQEKLF